MRFEGNNLRNELKYYISYNEYLVLKSRLKPLIKADPNMPDEQGYLISSVYFDDLCSSAYRQKIRGDRFRNKFRIRTYQRSDAKINLEMKSKFHDFIAKQSAPLSRKEFESILEGRYEFLINRNEEVCQRLLLHNRLHLLKPKVVVEYLREAYVFKAGNVRITFDKNLAANDTTMNIFSDQYSSHGVMPDDQMILEVKYDDFLPNMLSVILKDTISTRGAISKYVMCIDDKRSKYRW